MSRVNLKAYQKDCLKKLETFLIRARDAGAKLAFNGSESRHAFRVLRYDRWENFRWNLAILADDRVLLPILARSGLGTAGN